jgi:hypothetical protein
VELVAFRQRRFERQEGTVKITEQTTGRNRKMTVITADLMLLTMEAERWEPTWPSDGPEMTIRVYRAEPGNGTPSILIAQFPDIRAVYFSDDVELVKPEE